MCFFFLDACLFYVPFCFWSLAKIGCHGEKSHPRQPQFLMRGYSVPFHFVRLIFPRGCAMGYRCCRNEGPPPGGSPGLPKVTAFFLRPPAGRSLLNLVLKRHTETVNGTSISKLYGLFFTRAIPKGLTFVSEFKILCLMCMVCLVFQSVLR